jgi:RHS repeat-associated protein
VPSNPTSTAQFLYDGQGQRVEQSTTQSGPTTNTVYVGDTEEVSTTGGTTTTTAYYYMAGKRIGLSMNGAISYLASDGLGTATVTLSSSGTATAAQLFAPYGGVRYSSGTMPTMYGFTGQRSDSASGLDYYGARYYDPLVGQFTSGDSVVPGGGFDLWGLSRYAYVGGNPIIRVDPTGHIQETGEGGGCDPGDPSCGGGPVDTPPADPCGGDCYYDYAGDNGGTSYNPPPPDPAPATPYYRPRGGDPERGVHDTAPATPKTLPPHVAKLFDAFGPELDAIGGGGDGGADTSSDSGQDPAKDPSQNDSGAESPHFATIVVLDENGDLVTSQVFSSDNMTAEELAMPGWRGNAGHTEARGVRTLPLQKGWLMIIDGTNDPCPTCRGAMNSAAQQSGATIVYVWGGGSWQAGPGGPLTGEP